ncbi:hypothetical protein ACRS85_03900 [Pluralibacter gergoviae]|uniref:hypothetical protein n=1 Tax=Pluralibacter gergoviae TaxID=61647 RepID=UPI003EDFB8FB
MEKFMGTPPPWKWWTSNSFRRLSSADKDGGVICPTVQRSDGHPDLIVSKEDMALIEAAPELLGTLQELVFLYEHDEGCRELTEYKRAKAAINKALGKE